MRKINFIVTFLIMLCSIMMSSVNSKMVDKYEIKQESFNAKLYSKSKSSGNWLLDIIFKLFAPISRSGGARGDDFVCANSPSFDSGNNYLWTRRPLLMWSGLASSVKVVDLQSKQVVWKKMVDSNLKFGKAKIDKSLNLGGTYMWQVTPFKGSGSLEPSIKFKIVSISQNAKINLDLKKIENQSTDADEIILYKAKYFANMKMWADVQELLLKIPSTSPQYEKANYMISDIQSSLGTCYEIVE
jgi:hypothetical protein